MSEDVKAPPLVFHPLTEGQARDIADELMTIPGLRTEALPGIAADLVDWCQGFSFDKERYIPEQQALWLVSRLRNTWTEWHGTAEMKIIFDNKFTIAPPDPADEWRRQAKAEEKDRTRDHQTPAQIECAKIMAKAARHWDVDVPARAAAVKRILKTFDLSQVDFPQRWWAEREAGFSLTRDQLREVNDWLEAVEDPYQVGNRKKTTQYEVDRKDRERREMVQ